MKFLFSLPRLARRVASKGFSLVEVTIALGIFAFAFVAILGMLPAGLNTADSTVRQGEMSSILTSAAASIRGMQWDASGLKTGAWFGEDPLRLPVTSSTTNFLSEGRRITNNANARYRMVISTSTSTNWPGVLRANLEVSWPPGSTTPLSREQTVVFAPIPKK